MGKRIAAERQHLTPPHSNLHSTARSIRKRKRAAVKESVVEGKRQCLSGNSDWHENDDEDSSSSSSAHEAPTALLQTPQCIVGKQLHSSLLMSAANLNSSFGGLSDYNNSNATESPRPIYTLRPSVVNGTVLRDVLSKPWRLGRPIGKGNFGEIFLASDDALCPVSSETAKYVVKIEPHSNGPLFVEIHCLINTSQVKDNKNSTEQVIDTTTPKISNTPPSGIPSYIASGTHYFGDARYRFLVLPRFDRDLHSLIKNSRVAQKSLLLLAIHIINVLEHLHDKGYCHNDIKAQNLMISKCKYLKKQAITSNGNDTKTYDDHYEERQQTTDSGNSSEQEANDDDYYIKDEKFALKRVVDDDDLEDEDFDDGATTNSNNSNSLDMYQTPVNKNKKRRNRLNAIEYSGSNPVRSCRREKRNSMYEEMVKSHYLRPAKRISYIEFFNEDGFSVKADANSEQSPVTSENESEEFVPPSARRSAAASQKRLANSACAISTRATRRQGKLMRVTNRSSGVNGSQSSRSKRSGAALSNAVAAAVTPTQYQYVTVEEEHIFLIDFGLASKYQDHGVHRPFIMDQRRAHDGTLEFTSRDAHLGAHSRRSDLECLGYNLLYWSEGYLPWKDVAQQQQPEKVHRAKELFMTDVREMLRQFYGKQVPKYLGEFLQQIGQLAYQERPNYKRYRNLFKREYQRLGYDVNNMCLNSDEISHTSVYVKDEVDGINAKCDIFELNNKLAINAMRNSTLSTPFQEHSFTNRVSPKNLRSKSDKKSLKKKKFSWAEVLSQDPDQIARERAVKEFEREEVICPLQSRLPRRYEGKPTYAILAVEQSRRDKGLAVQEHNEEEADAEEDEQDRDSEEEGDDVPSDDDQTEEDNEDDETDSNSHSEAVTRKNRGSSRTGKRKQSPTQPAFSTNTNPRPRGRPVGSTAKLATKSSKPLSTVASNNKRGCATRKDHATLASATGEIEQHKRNGANSTAELKSRREKGQPRQRRTRRCLHKTESLMRGEQDVENNSNFETDMKSLYGVWAKYDDENSYGKGRHVNSSRHCRK
ncbi:uncharacterized protein LOC115625823 [Scaptodrosophila lebanonensis]|uniref:non-specific serine/threonine protein kinase n=1 Tax=Drosophila lebanonensis TaxID=7225 RepID=A0A6J2TLG7_DROLE|nr:uncharacterized protein LOC115625823 [Scaptodrosophila lebanonensis]XP_030376886.1 uncharacterized protein LOC115625823 [Scaptodrosophila lebanonensis]XP_030376894.1 uncharacterized protein LOC115625823 [Scaptodrosophila lebanonensis]